PVAFQAELAEPVEQGQFVVNAGPVLLVIGDGLGGAAEVAAGAAFAPVGRVQPRVELEVNAEEIADVIPLDAETLVVLMNKRGRRRAARLQKAVDETVGLVADDTQRCGFERLDKARGVADADHVLDPRALIAAGDELDAMRRLDLGILGAELLFCFIVGEKRARINIAAINEKLVVDSPAPA